jgi:hypothetical protein
MRAAQLLVRALHETRPPGRGRLAARNVRVAKSEKRRPPEQSEVVVRRPAQRLVYATGSARTWVTQTFTHPLVGAVRQALRARRHRRASVGESRARARATGRARAPSTHARLRGRRRRLVAQDVCPPCARVAVTCRVVSLRPTPHHARTYTYPVHGSFPRTERIGNTEAVMEHICQLEVSPARV